MRQNKKLLWYHTPQASVILLSAVTIPRACFDPTSGYKPTHMAQNTGRSLRHQKLNIILTWDNKKKIFSVLGGSRDCHYSLQLSREATPLKIHLE
jgi:hypothetical protein